MAREITADRVRLHQQPRAIFASGAAPTAASVALALVAVGLVLASLATSPLRLNDLGIAAALPPAYYIGIICLPLSGALLWARGTRWPVLLLLPVIAFLLVAWLTPLALEGTPRFRWSFANYGYTDPLVHGSPLDPARFIYHNWPLFPLLTAWIVQATHLAADTLLEWFPTVIVLLYVVPLAGLLRIAGQDDTAAATRAGRLVPPIPAYAWIAGIWYFLVLDWTGQDYFSPQAFAFLLYLGLLWVLARVTLRQEGRFGFASTAATLALFAALVVTHALTALIAVVVLAALWVARLHRRAGLVLVSAAMLVAWQSFVAARFYGAHPSELLGAAFSFTAFLQMNVAGRIVGSPDHQLVATARAAVTAIGFGVALLAAGLAHGVAGRFSREDRFAIALLAALALAAPVSAYGGEMLIRVVLFSLPALAILVTRATRVPLARTAVIAAIVVMAGLHVVTAYGNELYDYVSPAELQGFAAIDQLGPANVYGGFPGASYQDTARLDWRNAVLPTARTPLSVSDWLQPQTHQWAHTDWPVYVVVNRGDAAAAALFYNQPTLIATVRSRLDADRQFRLVFANADVRVYRWLGAPPPPPGQG